MISVIIITYNGAGKISRLLTSLNSVKSHAFEVLIVDDGSTDGTAQVIEKLKLDYPFRIITQVNSGRAQAKNRGASEAKGDLLWFLDDDMRITPGTLNAHYLHHEKFPGSISVGSTIEDDEYVTTDIQRYRINVTNHWKEIIEQIPNPLPVEDLFVASANLSISKSLFTQLGGFDTRLRDAEDLDLAYRAYLAAIPIYYNKAAIGYHMDKISCYSYVVRNRQYTKGYEILGKLNPHYYSINKRMHFSKPAGFKKTVISLISQPIFVWLVDHFNIFIILPKKLRYRFYEMFIFGLGRVFQQRRLLNA